MNLQHNQTSFSSVDIGLEYIFKDVFQLVSTQEKME